MAQYREMELKHVHGVIKKLAKAQGVLQDPAASTLLVRVVFGEGDFMDLLESLGQDVTSADRRAIARDINEARLADYGGNKQLDFSTCAGMVKRYRQITGAALHRVFGFSTQE